MDEAQVLLEKFCFKNSMATVHVSNGMKMLAFKKYGPSLSIVLPSLPSCTDAEFTRKTKLPGNHIVYQGGIVDSKSAKFSYRFYLPYFKRLCEAGVDVHVFPPRRTENTEKMLEYKAFAAENSRFHLHPSLPYKKLLEALSQFQWGLSGFNFDSVPEEGRPFLNNALPNKLFDYLYAGVCPIVINNETSAAFVEKLHVGYRADSIDNLVEICTGKTPLPPLTDLSEIDMDQQIEKLLHVYDACITANREKENERKRERESQILPVLSSLKYPIPFITSLTEPDGRSLLEMLLHYYMSGVWLYKEKNIYYSHTSADSHAFYLMALCNVYRKTKDPQTLGQLKSVADLLLCLENSNKGGNPGWGLGAEYINKLTKNKEVIPSSTTYTYTSCIAARALLTAYEITGDTIYLQRCAAWRQCFFNNIGLHPENGCCHYADHKSYHDIAAFVPNVTPLFMGFLAEYARVTGLKEDKPFLARLCRDFMALEKCGNWYYSTGRGEDLMHLALIAEGLHLTNSLLGPVADTKDVINTMLGIMFNGWSVNRTKKCLGTANWGPAGALSVFLRYGLRDHVAAGVDFLKKKSELMFYNIRTASLYAKFLSEL